jgi:three-Cys-motif partner protein
MSWGGEWTEEKLQTFEKYVRAYLNVMKANRDRFGWELIYLDAFAGSGSRGSDENDSEPRLSDLGISENDLAVYRGSAERILGMPIIRGFDFYYFVESDKQAKKELEDRLRKISGDKKLIFRDDANKELLKLSDAMKEKKTRRALVLVDPFGMQVEWQSIESMRGCNVDLWILIPSGVVINRLLDKKGELKRTERLKSFFGLEEDEIRDRFYKSETDHTLFGESVTVSKLPQSVKKITELYKERLRTVFKFVVDKPLELTNSKNLVIYSFACASNVEIAIKIASQIIKSGAK